MRRSNRSIWLLLPLGLLILYLFNNTAAEPIDSKDPAPPLLVDEWIKGKPVKLEEGKGKTVYVVEFWATWCPPCRVSIPHLTELQKKFAGQNVKIIGISDEPASKVRPFVEKMGAKMDYTVAVDEKQRTVTPYMKPYNVNSIPHAFIVGKKGSLVWHGNPLTDGLEEAIAAAVKEKVD